MRFIKFFQFHWPLVLIISIAAVLRFWRLEGLTTFSGDQGYDFLIIKRILTDGDFTLLGPKIGPYNEIGNLYLGPFYYYILAPALFLSRFDPIGPAVLSVILSILTIFIIYFFSLKYLSRTTGIFSSLIYGLNTFLINQSRASSNPHLIPFFAVVFLYSYLEILTSKVKQKIWPAICGTSLGIMFQLHYLTLAFAPLILIVAVRKKFSQLVILIASFILVISPQILFEFRNEFFITNIAIKQLKYGQNISSAERYWDHLMLSAQKLSSVFLMVSKPATLVYLLLVLSLIFYLVKFKSHRLPLSVLVISQVIVFIAVPFYSGNIELHYFAFIYPVVAILLGTVTTFYFDIFRHFLLRTVIVIIFAQIISSNLLTLNLDSKEGYTMPQGWNASGVKKAAKIIVQDTGPNSNFNIASTLDGDTRARPARYLTEVYDRIPLGVENYPQAETIYLISRDEEEQIKDYTVWEIASFMPFEISQKWEIQNNIKLYKLIKS